MEWIKSILNKPLPPFKKFYEIINSLSSYISFINQLILSIISSIFNNPVSFDNLFLLKLIFIINI